MPITSSSHFSKKELMCKCGCEHADMDEKFMEILEQIRDAYGKPMRVTSGYRCPYHNSKVSKTGPTGPHTTGKAVDVLVSGSEYVNLMRIALNFGIEGVGSMQKGPHSLRFVHLDTLGKRGWTY